MTIEEQARILQQAFNAKSYQLDTALKVAIEEASILVENAARVNAPVDKGLLKKSMSHRVIEQSGKVIGQIGTNVEYGPYMEFGTGIFAEKGDGRKTGWFYVDDKGEGHFTRGNRPQPFLRPALNKNRTKIKDIIAKRLRTKL